jgi:glyoxylase-like metal-dependent hydrolase (beta-lactamase superfamily II)
VRRGRSRDHAALTQEIESITSRRYVLDDATVVLPGHGDSTTTGESKAEYEMFASKQHDPDLHGAVPWLES